MLQLQKQSRSLKYSTAHKKGARVKILAPFFHGGLLFKNHLPADHFLARIGTAHSLTVIVDV